MNFYEFFMGYCGIFRILPDNSITIFNRREILMNTNRKRLFVLVLLLLLFCLAVASFAQTNNDPNFNEDANACFEGGTLAGVCNVTDADRDGDVDESDIEWMWTCGWYLIRADYGLIDRADIPLEGCELPERIIPIKKKKKTEAPSPTATPDILLD